MRAGTGTLWSNFYVRHEMLKDASMLFAEKAKTSFGQKHKSRKKPIIKQTSGGEKNGENT